MRETVSHKPTGTMHPCPTCGSPALWVTRSPLELAEVTCVMPCAPRYAPTWVLNRDLTLSRASSLTTRRKTT